MPVKRMIPAVSSADRNLGFVYKISELPKREELLNTVQISNLI
jgi:hypothetical protein